MDIARVDVAKMRASYEAYRAEVNRWRGVGDVELYPIYRWSNRIFVLTGTIKLVEGGQWVDVIDITTFYNQVARFSNFWPEQAWNDETRDRGRNKALVLFPDEGHTSMLLEDGQWVWVQNEQLSVALMSPITRDEFATLDNVIHAQVEVIAREIGGLSPEASEWLIKLGRRVAAYTNQYVIQTLRNTKQVAGELGISMKTVQKHAANYEIGHKVGPGQYVFRPEDIEALRAHIGKPGRPRKSEAIDE